MVSSFVTRYHVPTMAMFALIFLWFSCCLLITGVHSATEELTVGEVVVTHKNINSINWWSSGCRLVQFSGLAPKKDYSAIECKSVRTLVEDRVPVIKTFPKYVSYRYLLDTPYEEICGPLNQLELFVQLNATSCTEYFCDMAETAANNTKLHSRVLNFCQYCARSEFEEFHLRVANGSCPSFQFPSTSFCSNNEKFQDGYPLIFSRLVKSEPTNPYICACQKSKLYGFKCDGYSMFIVPWSQFVQPFIMFILCTIMSLVLLLGFIIPTIISHIRAAIKRRDEIKEAASQLVSLRLGMAIFLLVSLLLLGLESIMAIPYENVFMARHKIGDGVFRATALLSLFISMFTLFTLWLKVLYRADSLNQSGLPVLVKVLLASVYVFFVVFIAFPIAHMVSIQAKKKGVLNYVFFPLVLTNMILFALGFVIYGTKLFLRIRKAQRLTIFELKFTRFMIIQVVLLLLIALQMLFVIIEFTGRKVHFGISYRLFNFPLLDYTVLLVALAMMYQLFDFNKVTETFPCLEKVVQSCRKIYKRKTHSLNDDGYTRFDREMDANQ